MSRPKKEVSLPSYEQIENERKLLKRKSEFRKTIRGVVGVLVVVAALSVLIAALFLPILQISGASMEPTLQDRDVVVLIKTKQFDKGDLIGFHYQSKILLKRIVGCPGDTIDIEEDGTVLVNGERLEEPYISEKALGECDIEFPYQVPEQKYFVMGDRREVSVDSRSSVIGCVSKEDIIGAVMFRVWPLKRIANPSAMLWVSDVIGRRNSLCTI